MEKRDSPPKFVLPQQENSNQPEPTKQGVADPQASTDTVTSTGASFEGLNQYPGVSAPGTQASLTGDTPNNDLAAASGLSVDNARGANTHFHSNSRQPELFPGIMQSSYTALQAPQFTNGPTYFAPHVPYSPYSAFTQYPQMTWPCSLMPSAPLINHTATAQSDLASQPLSTTQQCHYQAQALYDRLEQQLKLIDRHRATHSHDANLAAQRLAIAQQRDEARTLIKCLEKHLEMEQNFASLHCSMVFSPQMNVQAPVYVPPPATSDQHALINHPSVMKAPVSAQRSDKTNSAAKRNPIPIVPPSDYHLRTGAPENPQGLAPQSTDIDQPISGIKVDDWANDEPESCAADREEGASIFGKSRHETTKPQAVRTPLRDSNQEDNKEHESITRSPSELDIVNHEEEDVLDNAPETDFGWTDINPGPVPPHIEELYDIHLDALRLPEGVVTSVEISDGRWMEVVGVNLKCPLESVMTDFEERYWRRKPTFTRDMLDRLKRAAKFKDAEKVDDESLMGRRKTNDR
jgi:hypothetical protein